MSPQHNRYHPIRRYRKIMKQCVLTEDALGETNYIYTLLNKYNDNNNKHKQTLIQYFYNNPNQ